MTYPLATIGPTIDATGISAPSLEDIILSLNASTYGIYGNDIVIDPDSQDGQWIGIYAQAQFNSNQAAIAVYNSFRPAGAVGAGLSSIVKLNGLQREASSNSTSIATCGGVAGSLLFAQVLQDPSGNLWDLPAVVTIPNTGTIDVTATCATPGAILAEANTLTKFTQTLGWQTVTNLEATPGAPVEEDGELRERQAISTAIPSQTSLSAITGAIANIPGVSRSTVYQNDTNATDADTLPAHSIAVVVAGGDSLAIASAIELLKNEGAGTYGDTTVIVVDPSGLPIPIHFFELTQTQVYVSLTITALPGFVSTTEDAITAALVAFINGLTIGEDVYQAWLLAEAGLANTGLQQTFVITALTLGTAPAPGGTATIAIAFNAAATTSTANIIITVT